jgi:hypothetical protein
MVARGGERVKSDYYVSVDFGTDEGLNENNSLTIALFVPVRFPRNDESLDDYISQVQSDLTKGFPKAFEEALQKIKDEYGTRFKNH